MGTATPSNGSPELRLAVSTLLRLASSDLQDARFLVRKGKQRNAALIGAQALRHCSIVLAAAEHGWPLDGWEGDLRALPDAIPILPELVAIDDLLEEALAPAVLGDGGPASAPDAVPVGDVLDRLAAVTDIIRSAFGVDLKGSGRAETVRPLRPVPPDVEPEPATSATGAKGDGGNGRRGRPEAGGEQPATSVPGLSPPKAPAASSTAFWSLVDRWGLSDVEALDLIGRPGGLTKAGTRPRFKVVGTEAQVFNYLTEIDTLLTMMGNAPGKWLRKPLKADPFSGATPLAHASRNGVAGARDVLRTLLEAGLQGSK